MERIKRIHLPDLNELDDGTRLIPDDNETFKDPHYRNHKINKIAGVTINNDYQRQKNINIQQKEEIHELKKERHQIIQSYKELTRKYEKLEKKHHRAAVIIAEYKNKTRNNELENEIILELIKENHQLKKQ